MLNAMNHDIIIDLDTALQKSALKGVFEPKTILEHFIKGMGFHTAVYYEAGEDFVTGNHSIVLTSFLSISRNIDTSVIGKKISYEESALSSRKGACLAIIQANDEDLPSESLNLAKALKIADCNRVHIPLSMQNNLVGAITCAWSGDVAEFDQSNQNCMRLIASAEFVNNFGTPLDRI